MAENLKRDVDDEAENVDKESVGNDSFTTATSSVSHLNVCKICHCSDEVDCSFSLWMYYIYLCLTGWAFPLDSPLPLCWQSEVCPPGVSPGEMLTERQRITVTVIRGG